MMCLKMKEVHVSECLCEYARNESRQTMDVVSAVY